MGRFHKAVAARLAAAEGMVNQHQQHPMGDGAHALAASVEDLTIEIVRSARRRSTISARLDGRRLIVRVPPGLKPEEERAWAERLGSRILAAQRRRTLNADPGLLARARSSTVVTSTDDWKSRMSAT